MLTNIFVRDFLILLVIGLSVSSVGFKKLVYFVSIGYAFSISIMSVAMIIIHRNALFSESGVFYLLHSFILIIYGIRLGSYILAREKSEVYKKENDDIKSRAAGVTIFKKIGIWIGVSILYAAMFMPCLYNIHFLLSSGTTPWTLLAGVTVSAAGLILEASADFQKSRFKQKHPGDFCSTGLYRFVRCPNYLGEITFWTGSLVAGISAYRNPAAWVIVIFGYVCIVLIMMGSTKRLESKQEERYGSRDDYRNFCARVPVLFPFIPLYSLKKIKVYLE